MHNVFLPPGQADRRWQFRNQRATNHLRRSFQTRVVGSGSLQASFVDGRFASASDVVVLQFLAVYALALGATLAEVGYLAIASGLAGAVELPVGVWLADRWPSLKRVVILGGDASARVALLPMALLAAVLDSR